MNADVAKKWAAELRSTPCGQTTGTLRETVEDCPHPAYCVMGVLCDLYLREQGGEWQKREVIDFGGEVLDTTWVCGDGFAANPPPEVLEWAGLRDSAEIDLYPLLPAPQKVGYYGVATFMTANDVYGVTFTQFADLIEQQAERL